MDLSKKIVIIKCSMGNITLRFDAALSLLLDYIKKDAVYYATDDYMNYGINLIERFVEIGKENDDTITLDFNSDDKDSDIYSSIIYGLKDRISFLEENIMYY